MPLPSTRSLPRDAQRAITEALGAFTLAFMLSLSAPSASAVAPGATCGGVPVLGAAVTALIFALAHVSALGLFNPAVTLGSFLAGQLAAPLALVFVAAQSAGATVGGVLGNALRSERVASCNPANLGKAFAAEAIFAGALVLVAQNVMGKHASSPNSYFALAIGFVVAAASLVVSPISGGVINPALGLGIDFSTLAVDRGTFDDLWLYWLAPIVGALLATCFQVFMNRVDKIAVAVPAWCLRCCVRASAEEEANASLPLAVPASEFVGTFFYVLTASLSTTTGGAPGLATGLMVAAMVYALDHACSADFNPAVTLALALGRGTLIEDRGKVLVVVLAQFGGAFAAAAVALTLDGSVGYPSADGFNLGNGGTVVFETVWTAVLCFVVLACRLGRGEGGSEAENNHVLSFSGIAIGSVYFAGAACAGAGGSGSGGVFNPVRCMCRQVLHTTL